MSQTVAVVTLVSTPTVISTAVSAAIHSMATYAARGSSGYQAA